MRESSLGAKLRLLFILALIPCTPTLLISCNGMTNAAAVQSLSTTNFAALTAPAPGATVSGPVELQAVSGGSVAYVTFSVDGNLFDTVNTSPHYVSKLLETANLTPGQHMITVKGYDSNRNLLDSMDFTIMVAAISPSPTPTPNPTPTMAAGLQNCPSNYVGDVLNLVNAERAKNGAGPLTINALLEPAAEKRAVDMATAQNLSHTGWDTTIASFNYSSCSLGENIAFGYADPTTVVQAWINSPEHHANMINATFKDTGIGCVIDASGTTWWSEDFGGC